MTSTDKPAPLSTSLSTPGPIPKRAMVLAAGLGRRLQPMTDTLPKPLISVGGRTLLDRVLDRLEDVGVETVVVNLFHLGDMIRQHLEKRPAPLIEFSPEDERLETGGGIKGALPRLGEAPFYAANSDILWLDGTEDTLGRLAAAWDDDLMDGLLLVHSTVEAYGYDGKGDFNIDPMGVISRRAEGEVSPFMFTGVQILHRRLFDTAPEGPFSLNLLYDRAMEEGRLYAVVHDGEWFHIGTRKGLSVAEEYLQARYSGIRHR